ncbi:RNA-directed DNA polymerase, eukaryota, reverse transcriptase zinc-binding domain protein [Tanacetum coccineum]
MAWIKWDTILASYEKGGLNIGILKAFNLALLKKWRWRLVTKPDSLWVRVVKAIHGDDTGFGHKECKISGTWANIVKSYSMLHSKDIILWHTLQHKVGNGSSIRFWKDNWIGNESLSSMYNRLFHLDVDANCLLSDRLSNGIWSWNWCGQNLGSRNEESLENLLSEVIHVSVNNSPDSWQLSITNDGVFSVHDTRIHVDNIILLSRTPSTRWSKILPRKVNIFIWRLKIDRLPNRLNLSSQGLDTSSIYCPLCNVGVELNDHIFFGRDTTINLWRLIRVWIDVNMPSFSSCFEWLQWFEDWRATQISKDRVYCISSASLWSIWRFRNMAYCNAITRACKTLCLVYDYYVYELKGIVDGKGQQYELAP